MGAAVRNSWLRHLVLNPYTVAAILLAVLLVWNFWPRPVMEVGEAVPLPPAKEVRTVEKIVERVKYVKVYPPDVKAKLDLPDAVVAAPEKKVIATGKLDAEERGYTLIGVLDTQNGNAEVYARPDPLPWIGPGKTGAVGIAYGTGDVGISTKIYAYHDLLRIKALHAGARAEIDQRGQWWVGATVEYRF